jgi:hypothetical protein
MKKKKDPEIVVKERKLGRERAHGQCFKEDGLIEIDPTLGARVYLETLIHEIYHVEFPELSETQVLRKSKRMTRVLWNRQYRRVINK